MQAEDCVIEAQLDTHQVEERKLRAAIENGDLIDLDDPRSTEAARGKGKREAQQRAAAEASRAAKRAKNGKKGHPQFVDLRADSDDEGKARDSGRGANGAGAGAGAATAMGNGVANGAGGDVFGGLSLPASVFEELFAEEQSRMQREAATTAFPLPGQQPMASMPGMAGAPQMRQHAHPQGQQDRRQPTPTQFVQPPPRQQQRREPPRGRATARARTSSKSSSRSRSGRGSANGNASAQPKPKRSSSSRAPRSPPLFLPPLSEPEREKRFTELLAKFRSITANAVEETQRIVDNNDEEDLARVFKVKPGSYADSKDVWCVLASAAPRCKWRGSQPRVAEPASGPRFHCDRSVCWPAHSPR